MLLVRTKLAASHIHGFGLFAAEFIPAHTQTWRFVPGFDIEKTTEEFAAMPAHVQEWFRFYGYFDRNLNRYICDGDDARFINHSHEPNLHIDYALDSYGVVLSLRPIQIGEELTADYRTNEKDEEYLSTWITQK